MEKLFLDLQETAVEKENISNCFATDKWKAVQYKTKLGEGVMLLAAEDSSPKDITFNINLKGWHRIYIGIINLRSNDYTYLKLSKDMTFTGFRHSKFGNPIQWATEENAEEIYFGCADLTGQNMILSKPDSYISNTSGLLWIRCEEMTDSEVAEHLRIENNKNKCMQMHIDCDLHAEDSANCEDDYLIKLEKLKNTNTEFCTLEYSFDYDGYEYNGEMTFHRMDKRWSKGDYNFSKVKDSVYDKYVKYAHEIGIELFAGDRMSVTSFSSPYSRAFWKKKFVDNNPQYYCVNRDGSKTKICSYAYSQVQDYVLNNMKNVVKHGFDGVSLIFHRGMLLGFEKPVIDRFKAKYPDLNPFVLPMSDSRLNGIWCDIMTEFMIRVKKELGENIKINVITDYGLESPKNIGLDIVKWAKEGLIDIVTQAEMEVFEDLTDCMSQDNPNIIDLEKYNKRLLDYPIIRRNLGTNLKKILENIDEFLSLERDYGVKVYHVLPWHNSMTTDKYNEYVEELKKHGAKRFLAWNAYSSMWNLPEWYNITHIDNDKEDIVQRRFIRMLENDNVNVSHFYNNWRG